MFKKNKVYHGVPLYLLEKVLKKRIFHVKNQGWDLPLDFSKIFQALGWHRMRPQWMSLEWWEYGESSPLAISVIFMVIWRLFKPDLVVMTTNRGHGPWPWIYTSACSPTREIMRNHEILMRIWRWLEVSIQSWYHGSPTSSTMTCHDLA